VFSGYTFGAIITLPSAGHLANSAGGWPSIFYSSGVVTIIWVIVWCLMGANSPEEHQSITDAEKEYIVSSLNNTTSKKVSSLKLQPFYLDKTQS